MNQINLNIDLLDEKIQKINNLKLTCDVIDVNEVPLSGSGESIAIIQLVDKEYSLLKSAVVTLLQNSVSFFENVKNSMIEADSEASAKIE